MRTLKPLSIALRGSISILMVTLFVTVTILSSVGIASDTCSAFLKSDKLGQLVSLIRSSKSNSTDVWDKYELAKHPVLFVDDTDFKGCGALWTGKVDLLKVGDLRDVKTPSLFNFCAEKVYTACPKALTKLGIKHAIIYRLDNYLSSLSHIGLDVLQMNFSVLVHEGFHLFYQQLNLDTKSNWPTSYPTMLTPQERDQLDQCYYKNAESGHSIKEELRSLTAALDSLLSGKSMEQVKQEANKFIQLRKQRQQMLEGVFVQNEDGELLACNTAEMIMELGEGAAEYVGLKYSYNMQLLNQKSLKFYLDFYSSGDNGKPSSPYYRSGAIMLLIMSFDPTIQMNDLVERINHSSIIENTIFSEFQAWAATI